MMLPGEGEAYPSCTDVVGWRKCPTCGYAEPMTQNCSRVTCPICYTHWVKKSATRVSKRIHGFSYTCTHSRTSDDSVYSVFSVVTPSETTHKKTSRKHFPHMFPASLFFPCCSVSEAVFRVFFRGIPCFPCFPWLLQSKPHTKIPRKTTSHRDIQKPHHT